MKYSLNLKRNIVVLVFLVFLGLFFYAFFFESASFNSDSGASSQEAERDINGCIISQGYTYNSSFNLCINEPALDKTTRQILKLSKQYIKPAYGLAFVNISEEQCEGCFTLILSTITGPRTVDIVLNNPQLLKYYCSEDSRKADFCTTLYEPVCGQPLNETFSNSCLACLNKNIEFYYKGEC